MSSSVWVRIARRVAGAPLVLLALAAVLSVCWLLYRLEAGRIAEQQRVRESLRVSVLAQLMRAELSPVVDVLRLLADGDGLRNYLQGGSDAGLQAAHRRAQSVINTNPAFARLRFIDAGGRELLRVERGGNVATAAQLQDVSGTTYFRQSGTLSPDGLYISAFDLEPGPAGATDELTLRFAVTVQDAAGERRGIYVIDYLGAALIARLQTTISSYSDRLRILDADGYWLKGESVAQEWGFAMPERAQLTLARTDPALWGRIVAESDGQTPENPPFTWRRVLPEQFVDVSPGSIVSEHPYLVMASQVSPPDWQALFRGARQIMLAVAVVLAALTLLSAWLFRARHRALLQLRAANQMLEQRVQERTAALERSYQELHDRESLLEETGHLARVGGWEFDPATGEGTWTPEIGRIHDLDDSVRPSRDLGLQFYPGESRERLQAALAKSIADGSPYDLELEFISARGNHKWVRTISRPVVQDGRVVRMRGAMQDITERKHSELRLHTQLQRMHLLERTTRAIGERQDLESILQVVIQSLEEQLPLDFGCICTFDAIDRSLTVAAVGTASGALAARMDMGPQARIPIDANGLSRCVQGRLVYEPDVSASRFPFPQRIASGGLRSLVAAPLQIESKVFGVLIAARREADAFTSGDCEFLRQLSEHVALAANQAQLLAALKAAYEDLRTTQQAVMQQERLRVIGQMASGIAHDINNAISPIMLYTESLLETETGMSERARQSLRTIQQSVSDIAETVARLREFYRKREGQEGLQTVQLNGLIAQLPDLTRARWQAMPQKQGIVIDLRLELAEQLPPVQVLEAEIREALINLIFNAVDAMPAGGVLTVRTRRLDEARVGVEVADTGVGMDEETRRRCMEPFFTTKGERGTGLGMAMVYGVVQRHDGAIEIESAPGAGTCVRLIFAAAQAGATPQAEAGIATPAGLTILLVDDDLILLRSLREILEADGHKILMASGGRQGIEMFQQSQLPGARPVSVVITDLGMPHVDGRAVAAAVKQAAPQMPVILLTGWGERLISEGREVAHVDRVLGKPPRLRDLRQTLAELTSPGAQLG